MNNTVLKQILSISMSILTLMGGLTTKQPTISADTNTPYLPQTAFVQSAKSSKNLGAYNVTGGGTYRLQSSVGLSDSSITLSSFKEPISNIPYTMSYINTSVGYGTLDPANSTNKEFISFTGITQNADGTAQLTGVSRGMGFSYPFTASSTLQKTHSGQSVFILSNSPQVYNQFAIKGNNETIPGTWTYSASPIVPTPTTATQAANKSYVDGISISGAANADETTKGIVQISSQAQLYASTSVGSTGARLVLPLTYATTTNGWSGGLSSVPLRNPQPGAYIPITDPTTGQLDPSLINFNFAFNYPNTINGAITYTATTTFATTTATIGLFGTTSPLMNFSNPTLGVDGSALITGGLGIGTIATTTKGNLVVSGLASTTNLVVSGTCTNCATNGYEIKTGTFNLSAASPSTGSGSVACTAGKKVVGGGASGIQAATVNASVDSYPSDSSTWAVSIKANNGASGTITMYAICVNK